LSFRDKWHAVLAFGIEDPRGYNAGALYRVQGAILTKIPRGSLVQPWIPGQWRKAVGLSGTATKVRVAEFVYDRHISSNFAPRWPHDACDAYCIALATRNALQRTEAA
jgi:Holliday junction resolvasome RuvABC endonuclease subunit